MATWQECPICSRLQPVESSYFKYLAPEFDSPLPATAARLTVLPAMAGEDLEKRHTRRCPECGTLYDYLSYHEYSINGSEDCEELTRLDPEQASAFILSRARILEELRREIGMLESAAGATGDLIDRGRINGGELSQALEEMEQGRKKAQELHLHLQGLIEKLRGACPEILTAWAGAHARVCRRLLESLPDQSEDERTARSVAISDLDSWECFAKGSESFPVGDSPWLPEYDAHFDREIPAAG